MFTNILHRPIVRQALGGVAGAFIALMLYGAYDAASSGLAAMVGKSDSIITDDMRAENIAAVAARAREVLQELD